MDEPTNDLDIETIELLEERLLEYSGTLLLVSHDRDFLDQVVTATLVLDGNGGVTEYAGGCSDWMDRITGSSTQKSNPVKPYVPTKQSEPKKRKLLNKEREALKNLPGMIEQMEAERNRITQAMQDPSYYRNPENDPMKDQAELERLELEISKSYEKWEELDALS